MPFSLINFNGGTDKANRCTRSWMCSSPNRDKPVHRHRSLGSASLWAENAAELVFSTVGIASVNTDRREKDLAGGDDHIVIATSHRHAGNSTPTQAVNSELRGDALLAKNRANTALWQDAMGAIVSLLDDDSAGLQVRKSVSQ